VAADGYASWINNPDDPYDALELRRMESVQMMPGGPTSAPFSVKSGRRVNGAGLQVSIGGSPESWTVTPGPFEVYTSTYDTQGGWRGAIPDARSGPIGARPGNGTSRIDLIVVRIYDADTIGSGAREVKVERLQGQAGPSPQPPTPPAGSITYEVCQLLVPASGAITVTHSTERTVAAGGILPVPTTAAMDKLKTDGIAYAGLVVHNEQTDALHRYDGTNFKRVGPRYSPVPTPTVDGSNVAPRDDQIIRLINWVSATTTSQGLVVVPWPTPFPNGILHAPAVTTSGASQNPVVNAGAISKTSCTYVFPGVFNTAVKFTYEAVGW
jgi:hypothetical protein